MEAEEARVRIPPTISAGVILSYKCSAACRHCMYACSPRWSAAWISKDELEKLLALLVPRIRPSPWGASSMGLNDGLHFTGGEPFLNFELLLDAVEMAAGLGIPSTFVETNSFWCSDDVTTREKLELLKRKGLQGILVSVNPYYAEYVPFERTLRCVTIAQEVFGRNLAVYQLEYFQKFHQLGIRDRISLEDYLERTGHEPLDRNIELFLMGRATRTLRGLYPARPAEAYVHEPCRPPFLREWHNHFDNYGNLMPGFCGGLSLGRWEDLDLLETEGVDLEAHPVLRFLIQEDMLALLHFARDHGYQERPDGYLSRCDLCLDLRKLLASATDLPELEPREFYQHVE